MARKSTRLPKRFPVGTKYVVEGASNAHGVLEVTSRYVLLPNGRKVDLPTPAARSVCKAANASAVGPKSGRILSGRSRAGRGLSRAGL